MFPVRQSEGPFSASFRARLRDDRTRRLAGREHAKLTKAAFSPMAAYVVRFSDRIWLGRAVPMTATSWQSVVYSPLLDGETTLNAQVCTVSNSPCVSLLDATALPATLVELPQTGQKGGSSHRSPRFIGSRFAKAGFHRLPNFARSLCIVSSELSAASDPVGRSFAL